MGSEGRAASGRPGMAGSEGRVGMAGSGRPGMAGTTADGTTGRAGSCLAATPECSESQGG